jgi:hypothetical protein
MELLQVPFEREEVRPATTDALRSLALVATGLLAAVALAPAAGAMLGAGPGAVRAIQGAAVHGGFIAMGFVVAFEGTPAWRGPALRLAVALLVAFVASRWEPWGCLAFLGVPILLLREVRVHEALGRTGRAGLPSPRLALLGAASGAFLGGHLLVSASMTFGHPVRPPAVGAYLAALMYDVGASALSAEWLFRGALFSHWWRHWGFWAAASLSTAASLVRYLLDPALPRTIEMSAGAVFYMALLGLYAAGLRARSGSLVPGYLATIAFFAAYRMLVVG